jgi:hypothetical protein
MKNKNLLLLALLGAGAYYIIYAQSRKKRSYTIEVPPPTKITEEQFRQGQGIVKKAVPVVKSIISLFKKKPKLTTQQQQAVKTLTSGRRLFGNPEFPDFC